MINARTKTKKNDNYSNIISLILIFTMSSVSTSLFAQENHQRDRNRFQSTQSDKNSAKPRFEDFHAQRAAQNRNRNENSQRNIWQSNSNTNQQAPAARSDTIVIQQNNSVERNANNMAGAVLGRTRDIQAQEVPRETRQERPNYQSRNNNFGRNEQSRNNYSRDYSNNNYSNNQTRHNSYNNSYNNNRNNNWNYSYGGHNYNFETQRRGNFRYSDRNSNNYWGPNGRWSHWDNRWGDARAYAKRWGFDDYHPSRGWRRGNNWYSHPSQWNNWGGWHSFFLSSNGIFGFSFSNNSYPYYSNSGDCMRLETTDYIRGQRAAISFLACANHWNEWEEIPGTRRIEYWLY